MSEQASDFLALTLQERVRRFNLGTPTALHVGTHELVNDLWQTHANTLAVLQLIRVEFKEFLGEDRRSRMVRDKIDAAIAKATGA